jgi:hypothetical protein
VIDPTMNPPTSKHVRLKMSQPSASTIYVSNIITATAIK